MAEQEVHRELIEPKRLGEEDLEDIQVRLHEDYRNAESYYDRNDSFLFELNLLNCSSMSSLALILIILIHLNVLFRYQGKIKFKQSLFI